jgi:hypothetical protein
MSSLCAAWKRIPQQCRFLSFHVPQLQSSWAGTCLSTQLGVTWLVFHQELLYTPCPYGSRTALHNHCLRTHWLVLPVLYNVRMDRTENTASNNFSIVAYVSVAVAAITGQLLSHCLARSMFAEPLLSNGCLCWLLANMPHCIQLLHEQILYRKKAYG